MKFINASGGGGGGTGSDDVTAMNKNVLENFTAVTRESDDDPAKGTMPNLTDRATVTHTTTDKAKVLISDNATITTNSDGVRRIGLRYNGAEGFIKPNTIVSFPEAQAGKGFGVSADKIATGQNVLGITGTYKGLGNATAGQVLRGYSFSTNTLSNVAGDMPDNGAWNSNIAINGNVVIPAGYHNGSGKVGQSVPVQGGAYYSPLNYNRVVVSGGRYLSGDIGVYGDSNFTAGNIKKGVTLWGVRGTFEGYVPTPTDLYLRGNNPGGFTLSSLSSYHTFEFQAEQIYFHTGYDNKPRFRMTSRSINIAGHTKFIFQGPELLLGSPTSFEVWVNAKKIGTKAVGPVNNIKDYVVIIDINTQLSCVGVLEFQWVVFGAGYHGYITRIYTK